MAMTPLTSGQITIRAPQRSGGGPRLAGVPPERCHRGKRCLLRHYILAAYMASGT